MRNTQGFPPDPIFLFSSVVYVQYTPSSKRNLPSKILYKSLPTYFLTLTKYNKTQPDSSDWVLYLIRQKLFLSALVSLVELIDTTCSIHELNLTGVEWM